MSNDRRANRPDESTDEGPYECRNRLRYLKYRRLLRRQLEGVVTLNQTLCLGP
jgi:hypothetical protein